MVVMVAVIAIVAVVVEAGRGSSRSQVVEVTTVKIVVQQ